MSKDPGFIFYPGDYLRDTQNLSEKSQVAYDRIMCEHMRNICVSHQQVNFFTKRLNEEEKAELLFLLTETEHGFYIEWVFDSITKRKAYSASRSKNRSSKKEEKPPNTSSTYVQHMENEDENENRIENKDRKEGVEEREGIIYPWPTDTFKSAWRKWVTYCKKQHDKEHLTFDGEQLELRDLNQLAKTEAEAIGIIEYCISRTWKHLRKPNDEENKGAGNNGGRNQGVSYSHGGKNSNSTLRSADRKDFNTG